MSRDKLNIIIPFYNPRPGWENNFVNFLPEIEKELKETDFTIILVNDGSTIQITQIDDLIERFRYLRYYSIPINMGKGYAVRYGISRSDADFYVYTDVDFPFGYKIICNWYQRRFLFQNAST
jgi:glycosyltransferase involved in cell wall biosynthesis